MPRVPRKNIDPNLGHGCSPSLCLEADNNPTTTTFQDAQPVLLGDKYQDHSYCPVPAVHPVFTVLASPNIFVNDRMLVREGDLLSCGDLAGINPAVPSTILANDIFTPFSTGGTGGGGGAGGGGVGGGSFGSQVSIQSFPYARYNDSIAKIEKDAQGRYKRHCPFRTVPQEVYTPLVFGSREFRNYPGPPLTTQSGAQDLPAGAPEFFRNPIKVKFKFGKLYPGFGTPFTNIQTVENYYNLHIDEATGEITGSIPTSFENFNIFVPFYVGMEILGESYFPEDQQGSPFRRIVKIRLIPGNCN